MVPFQARTKDISLLENIQPGYGTHPAYYSMDTEGPFPRSKVTGV
jgi:hypothetical protein